MRLPVRKWRSEDIWSILSTHHVRPRDRTQDTRLGGRCLYLQNHVIRLSADTLWEDSSFRCDTHSKKISIPMLLM